MDKIEIKLERQDMPTNESIVATLFVHGQNVGEIELYLNEDTIKGVDMDEYTLSYRRYVPEEYMEDEDPVMVAQGNIAPRV